MYQNAIVCDTIQPIIRVDWNNTQDRPPLINNKMICLTQPDTTTEFEPITVRASTIINM